MADPENLRLILAAERDCLLRGALAELPGLSQRKAAALEALANGGPRSHATLQSLRDMTAANQGLLDAAHMGVRAALARIDAIRAAGSGLTSYDARGRSVRHCPAVPDIERRA